jgi:hypothetical protein
MSLGKKKLYDKFEVYYITMEALINNFLDLLRFVPYIQEDKVKI